MTSQPPTEPVSRITRLLAAAVIAMAALGITWMADRAIPHGPELTNPLQPR